VRVFARDGKKVINSLRLVIVAVLTGVGWPRLSMTNTYKRLKIAFWVECVDTRLRVCMGMLV
jgi:hypothetical protein